MIPDAAPLLLPASAEVTARLTSFGCHGVGEEAVVVCVLPTMAAAGPRALPRALWREVHLARHRLGPGFEVVAQHRFGPPARTAGGRRGQLRSWLVGGIAVEASRVGRYVRVIDEIVGSAGVTDPGPLGVGSDGSALVRARRGGAWVFLRAGRRHGPADPAPAATALAALAERAVADVPRLVGQGRRGDVAWTCETALDGERPPQLSAPLLERAAAFLERLPAEAGSPRSFDDDLDRLIGRLAGRGDDLAALRARVGEAVAELPAVWRHGDFWTGNVLVDRDGLLRVLDWDAWHAEAVPGTDLLQLIATEERHRAKRSLGAAWTSRPWDREPTRSLLRRHLGRCGAPTGPAHLAAVGTAWWAAEAAGTLSRRPDLADDQAWVARNIDPVLTSSLRSRRHTR